MLIVNYNENKPASNFYNFSVQGNNDVDKVRFIIQKEQVGLDLGELWTPYVCVQSEDGTFVDKAEIEFAYENDDENIVAYDWIIERKHTENKVLLVSLCLEYENQCWNTQSFKLTINNGVLADEEIENNYPTVLQQLEKRIEELEKGGGTGGGSNDVAIERVWLTYEPLLMINQLVCLVNSGAGIEGNEMAINDPRKVYVNIKTTPIGKNIETEIENGKFVIRFDYPIKKKAFLGFYNDDGIVRYQRSYSKKIWHHNTDKRAGYRSFAPSLYAKKAGNITRIDKADTLLNSLIFVNQNNIKVNDYGEKYIHIRITYEDFIKKFYTLATDFSWYNEMLDDTSWLADWFDGSYVGGCVNTSSNGRTQTGGLYSTSFNGNSIKSRTSSIVAAMNISQSKFHPTTDFCGAFVVAHSSTMGYGLYHIFARNPFALKKNEKYYNATENSRYYLQPSKRIDRPTFNGHLKYNSTVAIKPRCCILKEDYLTNIDTMWAKKFSQGSQSIRITCNGGLYQDTDQDNCLFNFRIHIQRQ